MDLYLIAFLLPTPSRTFLLTTSASPTSFQTQAIAVPMLTFTPSPYMKKKERASLLVLGIPLGFGFLSFSLVTYINVRSDGTSYSPLRPVYHYTEKRKYSLCYFIYFLKEEDLRFSKVN